MLGNLYVQPAQNGSPGPTGPHLYPLRLQRRRRRTGYNKEYALQLGSMDHNFHDASESIQPLPSRHEGYVPMINGRGYPDTVNPTPLPAPDENGGIVSQKVSSLITINRAVEENAPAAHFRPQRDELLHVDRAGPSHEGVGGGARIAAGPDGKDLFQDTNSVTWRRRGGGGDHRHRRRSRRERTSSTPRTSIPQQHDETSAE